MIVKWDPDPYQDPKKILSFGSTIRACCSDTTGKMMKPLFSIRGLEFGCQSSVRSGYSFFIYKRIIILAKIKEKF